MTPNQSDITGLELALQLWNNGGPAAHFAAQLRGLIEQAKAAPTEAEDCSQADSIAHLTKCADDTCERCENLMYFYQACDDCGAWGHNDAGPCLCTSRDAPADHSEPVVHVQVTGSIDEIDSPVWPFINEEARTVGAEKGRIETYQYERANGGVVVLWDGPRVHAMAVTIRDDLNRTRCVRMLATQSASAHGWISVDDRLPDQHKAEYLCLFAGGQQQVTEWLLDDTDGWVFWYGDPTHWMPLLAAPTEHVKP